MSAFDRIIGYSGIKQELIRICDTLRNGEVYQKLGITAPRGLLLHGQPGVGKSLMAAAFIEESGRRAFVCRKNKPDGDFVKEIKATFEQAAENGPSIVLLDDMDKFANGDERHPDAEEYVTVQSCIDEVRGRQVFVLATANNIRCLPRSLKRAGRFDRIIRVEAPEGEDAEAIIAHYLGQRSFMKDVDARTVARLLNGKSCAELETVINAAGLYAGFERAEAITMNHFMAACMAVVFDVPCDSSTLPANRALLDQVVCHETGHAVVSEVLVPESVVLVSVHQRGLDFGGFTHYYNDHTHIPLDWKKSRIAGALGGMAAVEQVMGIQDSGSGSDVNDAFELTRELVTEVCACGLHLYAAGNDSDATKLGQEQAAAAEMERYYRKAKEIIARNRGFFDEVAATLVQKGMVNMVDMREIKSRYEIVPVPV